MHICFYFGYNHKSLKSIFCSFIYVLLIWYALLCYYFYSISFSYLQINIHERCNIFFLPINLQSSINGSAIYPFTIQLSIHLHVVLSFISGTFQISQPNLVSNRFLSRTSSVFCRILLVVTTSQLDLWVTPSTKCWLSFTSNLSRSLKWCVLYIFVLSTQDKAS